MYIYELDNFIRYGVVLCLQATDTSVLDLVIHACCDPLPVYYNSLNRPLLMKHIVSDIGD